MIQLRKTNINTKSHWDSVFETEISNNSSRIALDRFDTTLDLIEDGCKVMDIGCGRGEFINYLLTKKPNCLALGMDLSPVAIDFAKQTIANGYFMVCDISTEEYVNKDKFDVITSFEVLEHLSDPHRLIKMAENNIARGGIFVITLPFENMIDGGDEHVNSFTFSDIITLFNEHWDVLTMSRYYRGFSNLFVLARYK